MPPNSDANIAYLHTHFHTQNPRPIFTVLWSGTFLSVLAISFFLLQLTVYLGSF